MGPTDVLTSGAARAEQAVAEFFDPAYRDDPYSRYDVMREMAPLHPSPFGLPLANRYEDCVAILSNADWGHDQELEQLHPNVSPSDFPSTFLWMEPPDHTRLRGLVSKGFTPRHVAGLRPRIEALVDGLIDNSLAAGEFDLIDTIAYPLPLTVVCELLGVPGADHPQVQEWSQPLARSFDPDVLVRPEELDARNAAIPAFLDYFRDLVRAQRRSPGDNIIGVLSRVEEQGDRLTEDELLGTCITLLIAGHETTVNLVGNGMLALLRHPDQFAELCAHPELIPSAVQELLRYDSPIHMNTRSAKREMEVGGRVFAPGEGVVALIACANRDPAVFDDPDRLDLRRYARGDVARHLSFSLGHHYCLGAPLALLEMQILLTALIRRVGTMELLTERPAYKPNILLRGLAHLPVRFRPRTEA
ncbi:cytochrome P450 [Pseudofrankia sp. BMG5.37]|uniref:cytochrome P450 n=1 Tax=Pseudofrankia sp. BMG5.37 TaxID=3050035 RepID=UPI002893F621|nr:cytochrome P450 [Pseudofrankia sp. BMG5.37]MDT3443887.1 cytochrome P450 [Pseudofrankia sp. BMG5.37]